jgi:phosphoribosylamine--glycine ligase
MGAYSPADHLLQEQNTQDIIDTIIQPTVDAMKERGEDFSGFLYAGLMMTKDGAKLLEYNVRFGDPETQPTVMRLESDFAEMCLAGAESKLDTIDDVQWSTKKAVTIVLAAHGYP